MLEVFLAALAGTTVGAIALGALGKAWLEARLRESIKHEYDQALARFKQTLDEQQLQKQKVELVSELLAEWLANPPGEIFSKEYRTRLNRLSFQASLWLPAALAIELSKRLQVKPDAKSAFELVLLARRQLIGDQSLTVEHVTFWDVKFEKVHPVEAPLPEQVNAPKPLA
jgi:hypothetical protein